MTTTVKLLTIIPRSDRTEYVSRIYPRAAGISLADTTRTATAPYMLDKTAGYIRNSTAETNIGRVDRPVSLQIDMPTTYNSLHLKQVYAADALFDKALEWLKQHDSIADFYTITVDGIPGLFHPGQTIHVTTTTMVSGQAAYVIDDDFNVMTVSSTFNDAGRLIATMEITTIEREAVSDAQVLAGAVINASRQTAGSAGSSITNITNAGVTAGADIDVTSGVVARKGTDILLFSGGGALLGEYAHTGAGLIQATAAMVSGDVIEMPAGTIIGDVSIPAGGMLRGLGWQSILNGMVTLSDGAGAEHLKVVQNVDTSDDIIGIIGPATGEATIRDVQVALTQAGVGKALGLLSNGGILRAYECEIWVHGNANSAWGAASVTGGLVEINQGQVKAWKDV